MAGRAVVGVSELPVHSSFAQTSTPQRYLTKERAVVGVSELPVHSSFAQTSTPQRYMAKEEEAVVPCVGDAMLPSRF
jgi:hypothetical protein